MNLQMYGKNILHKENWGARISRRRRSRGTNWAEWQFFIMVFRLTHLWFERNAFFIQFYFDFFIGLYSLLCLLFQNYSTFVSFTDFLRHLCWNILLHYENAAEVSTPLVFFRPYWVECVSSYWFEVIFYLFFFGNGAKKLQEKSVEMNRWIPKFH